MFNRTPFTPGHVRSHSQGELMKMSGTNPPLALSTYNFRKRVCEDDQADQRSKRSRTAPPSPPSPPHEQNLAAGVHLKVLKKYSKSLRSRSLSPNKRFLNPLSPNSSPIASPKANAAKAKTHQETRRVPYDPPIEPANNIQLPLISSALNSAPLTTSEPVKLKPIAPTVSLNYFDTYKPNDENWRYELLDSINRGSKNFNLNQYNYLNKHASAFYKPSFDSRISSKITKPTLIPSIHQYERKINFPYESNYTYLNKTYLNDVEKYPEYLELAQSLIQLSQPKQMTPPSPLTHQERPVTPQPASSPLMYAGVPPPITTQNSNLAPAQTQTKPYKHFASVRRESPSEHNSQAPSNVQYLHYESPTDYVSHSSNQYDQAARLAKLHGRDVLDARQMLPYVANVQTHEPQAQSIMLHQSPPLAQPAQAPVVHNHRFIPITPPSSSKSKSKEIKSPPKSHSNHNGNTRVCISCGSDQSPCWRPSWSIKEGQLCNSCGLRYKKTSARCLNKNCKKIPAKGDWSLMQSKGKLKFEDGVEGYSCLECGWRVEVKKP